MSRLLCVVAFWGSLDHSGDLAFWGSSKDRSVTKDEPSTVRSCIWGFPDHGKGVAFWGSPKDRSEACEHDPSLKNG